ncbi:MAG: beta-galactosidase [Tepidisphaeraceae bacterium]
MTKTRSLTALSLAAGATLLALCDSAWAADAALFDITPASARTLTTPTGRCQFLHVKGQSLLRLRSDPQKGAEVVFPTPAGGWDLSAREGIAIRLRNPGTSAVTVRVRAENPSAAGLMDASQNAVELAPGEERNLLLRLTRRPEDPTFAPFQKFYMYVKAINVRDNTLDPAHITALKIGLDPSAKDATVEILSIDPAGQGKPAPVPFFPFIDAYGQYTHGDWPGKIHADADFAERRAQEQKEQAGWPGPRDWDAYGGWAAGPKLKASGFFRVQKYKDKWWLVDPDGRLFWSYGATGVGFGGDVSPITDRRDWFVELPAKDSPLGQFYHAGHDATYMYYQHRDWEGFDIQQANLFRKYGPDYRQAVAQVSHDRLRSWGFNTMGNWSAPEIYRLDRTPYTVAISYGSALIHFHMPDVYDPGWEPALKARMEKERGTTSNDPWNLGYFIDNERWFGWRPRGAAIAEETMKNPPERKAKQKFAELLRNKYKSIDALNKAWSTQYASWDAFLAYRPTNEQASAMMKNPTILADSGDFGMMFAERYFSVCHNVAKSVAPNIMYLGSRFFGHTDPELVKLASKYCDVISYNIYDNPPDGRVNQYAKLDVPMLSSEWGIGSDPLQTPFRGKDMKTQTPAERAAEMVKYTEHALRLPNLVGAHFFQFRDQPLSGRPDGEATLRGFVNVTDTPNFDLVQANRRVAYPLYETRMNAR